MMKYFKSPAGEVFAFNGDGTQDAFIPDGLFAITESEAELLSNPGPTKEQEYAAAIAIRNNALKDTDWMVQRHRDQVDLGAGLTLSGDQYQSLLVYRQILRDLTKDARFPKVALPEKPTF